MDYFRVIFILFVVSFCDIISSLVIPNESSTEANNLLEKNINHTNSKRDRIGFDNLKFFTVVQDDKNDTIFSFDEYYNLTQIYTYLDYLQRKYNNIVEILPIGQTWENRTIKTVKISSGHPNNSAIWIDGGIHAREWISISSVLFTLNTLLTNWHKLDEAFRNVDYYITPVLNPDGYEFTHSHERFWRLNRRKLDKCYGVDLNRNFPYKWLVHMNPLGWRANYTSPACTDEYAGVAPSSEPETKAVIGFISKFPNKFKGFLTFHTYGQIILYPYGYDFLVPRRFVVLKQIAQAASDKILNVTGLKYEVASGSQMYLFAGNSMDWAYKVAKIPYSYLVELRNESFDQPPSEIVPAGKEALIIAMTLVDNFDSNAEIPSVPAYKSYYENLVVESDE